MNIPRNAKRIIEILQHNSHDAYVVGGCVRDTLMGEVPGDWDITTSARPEVVKSLFKRTIDTGIEHGTVTVLMNPGRNEDGSYADGFESYEVTTYRIDGDYSDHRRPDKVEFSDSLLEDLKRRDFTINAMAYNDVAGIVDEFDGRQDLEDKIIRCVGNADERFEEDALRMLRAIRFSAKLGFDIEKETIEAIRKHAPELEHVSAERIYVELYKTLISSDPYKLQLLWDLGLAPFVSPSFTRIEDARGVLVSDACPADEDHASEAPLHLTYAPWAGLMRNIVSDDAKLILKELKSDNDTIRNTCLLVAEYKLALPRSKYEIKKCLNRIGPELFEDLLELKRDAHDDKEIEVVRKLAREVILKNEPYRISDLEIDGHAVMALGYKGREVGEVLESLLDKVTENPSLNTRSSLEKLAERKQDE